MTVASVLSDIGVSGMVGLIVAAFVALGALTYAPTVDAAEGGADSYLPGFYGDFGMAALPDKGLYYQNLLLYSQTKADVVLRQGRIHKGIENEALTNIFGVLYVSDLTVLGGTYYVDFYLPLKYARFDADVEAGNLFQRMSADTFGVADMFAVPLGINWKMSSVSVSLYQGFNVPVGRYDPVSTQHPAWSG